MRVIIHDLPEDTANDIVTAKAETTVLFAHDKTAHCIGCFGCWLKTPGHCFIKDELQHIGACIGTCDELILISENWYGGYSAAVKKVLDRSIAFALPFFTYRGGMIRHRLRYKQQRDLRVILYGSFTEGEKDAAHAMVAANQVNLGCKSSALDMIPSIDGLGALL